MIPLSAHASARTSADSSARSARRFFAVVAALVVAALAAAAFGESKPISWTGKDAKGSAVTVPADKVTLVFFARPGQAQTAKAVEAIAASLKDRNIAAVAIVSGEDAAQTAGGLKWTGPVAIDPSYAAKNAFGVRAWPTTVVLLKDGTEAAHIAGLPASFSRDLDAHLDFATGKIDAAARDKLLGGSAVISDSASQKAARHVEVAQRLVEKGMADAARAELAKALDLKPTEDVIHLAVARTHLMLGNPAAADAVLAALSGKSLPAGELNLLKGWSAVQAGKWDDALALLADAAKLNPQPSEACYLLGVVYQKKNDPAKAAENFRKAFEHTPAGRALSAGQ